MVNHIHVEVENDDQYEWLQDVKNENGLSWRGLLIHAANDLEDRSERWEPQDRQ